MPESSGYAREYRGCAERNISDLPSPTSRQATAFFVQLIGCDYMFELGPFESQDDWMAAHLNVHPRTVMRRAGWIFSL